MWDNVLVSLDLLWTLVLVVLFIVMIVFDINLYYLNKFFMSINDELNLGKAGTYNRFRSHMLRKFNASALYNADNGLSLDEIDALQGRSKDKTHNSYFMENPNALKNKYVEALPSITIFQ